MKSPLQCLESTAGPPTLVTCVCLIMAMSCTVSFAKPRRKPNVTRSNRTVRVSREDLIKRYSLNQSVRDSNGPKLRQHLQAILSRGDVKRFLAVIKKAEGGKPRIMVGGCQARTLRQHPALTLPKRCRFSIRVNGRRTFSTASGNYQITYSNWKRIAPFLGLQSFSENDQALAALELIRRGGGAAEARTSRGIALKRRIQTGFLYLLKGRLSKALCFATFDWASSSCSSLPAGYKLNYAGLLNSTTKSKAKFRSAKARPGRVRR